MYSDHYFNKSVTEDKTSLSVIRHTAHLSSSKSVKRAHDQVATVACDLAARSDSDVSPKALLCSDSC
jgi:hypothetical protein